MKSIIMLSTMAIGCVSFPCDRYKDDQLMFVEDLQQCRLEACVQAVKDRMEQDKKMCQEGSK